MTRPILAIGNKNHSSWSLRPWLALKAAGVVFDEQLIPLRQPDSKARILAFSPAGKVPALKIGGLLLWDSLSICEYVAETYPQAGLWPADAEARAVARSVAAEMHSGFMGLRRDLSMDIQRRLPLPALADDACGDIARVLAVWNECRAEYGKAGPYLFGGFSIADCMYAPVVTRFRTYGYGLDAVCQAYSDAVFAHPAMAEWCKAAEAETPLPL